MGGVSGCAHVVHRHAWNSFTQAQLPVEKPVDPAHEERERQRKLKQGQRLQEINAKRRQEKVGLCYLLLNVSECSSSVGIGFFMWLNTLDVLGRHDG